MICVIQEVERTTTAASNRIEEEPNLKVCLINGENVYVVSDFYVTSAEFHIELFSGVEFTTEIEEELYSPGFSRRQMRLDEKGPTNRFNITAYRYILRSWSNQLMRT